MASARDIFRRGAEFLGEHGFGNQCPGIGADDVDAENPVAVALGEDFDETFGIAVGPRGLAVNGNLPAR